MKDSYIIGVIGAGNMGEALIKGLLRAQLVRPYEIIASARTQKRINYIEKEYGIHTTRDNLKLIAATDIVVLGIKPQNMEEVCQEIGPAVTDHHLFISIAAGIDMAKLRKLLGKKPLLIRVMPNLPALIDEGISAIFCAPRMPERYRRFAHQIFQAVGQTVDITNEKQMDAITALSGTGPAYFFALMEAMKKAGQKVGLPAELVHKLTIQTAVGAAQIAAQNGADPEKLRAAVTSKKGTTWAAMKVFEKRGFWKLLEDAIRAAAKRAGELRKMKE